MRVAFKSVKFFLLIVLIGASTTSESTSCRTITYGSVEKDMASAFSTYDLIATAIVEMSQDEALAESPSGNLELDLKIIRSIKGSEKERSYRVKVSPFDRSYKFAPGREYLVFGRVKAGYAIVGDCSPTRLLANSQKKLAALNEMKAVD